ncbi:uncharacterized protein N7477_001743 [Penicillium maclennaniae]|uniref:uncharacterized protein n=1 Tax=Penicillium maclennaniae TaxID=1343394 RepID=UPI0025412D79|nr:uncharacterized protein N7477_001743 [Penicillium maclennaniae]KAJ5681803.1 hypothetical protein N7477_001743 [Penicillium maclennaniae]
MLSWVYPLRLVQALFALATIGLTAFVIATLYDKWSFSNTIYFVLFNGCWTLVVAVPYLGLAPLWIPRLSHELVIPGVEIITSCLWLAGWIALAAQIPGPSSCNYPSCHGLQALIVVGAVEWALFLFTNVFAIMDIVNSKRNTRDREVRRSAAQSQATSEAASEVAEVNGPQHV